MEAVLRVLIVEDSEDDAALLQRHLTQIGYQVVARRVETAAAMRQALADEVWDVVLSDWSMPQFSARAAFAVMKESPLDLPFIIVSGTIGEEIAVEAMRTGVNDFFVKGRLARLGTAIERERRDVETRRSRTDMVEQLSRKHAETLVLERDREQARRESEFKSKFLAGMSHELRTPLNAIIGFSSLLDEEIAGPLGPIQKEYVCDILQSGRYLLALINDILDLSKIEAGRMELRLEPVSLGAIVDGVVGVVKTLAQQRNINLEFAVPDDLPDIDADPMRIKQILYNLLSNGIKFTPPGGHVRLTVRRDDAQIHISVADTGVGIAQGDIPRLFREFEQIEPRSGEKPQGTGLGLALTQRLVALHGGSVAVQSEPDRGSTFTVVLPANRKERELP